MSSDAGPLIPPRYANVPSLPIYDPDLPDPLFRTFVRLTGLAWVNDYHETPPLTTAELCAVCHCSERTLWGHLGELRKRGLMAWETNGGEMVLSPVQPAAVQEGDGASTEDNLAALADYGVKTNVAVARQVAALPHVTPALIRAWGDHYLARAGIRNLPGLLLHTLQATTSLPRQGRDPRGGPRLRDGDSLADHALQPSLPALALDDELSEALERLGLAGDDAWAEVARVAAEDAEFVRAWVKYVEGHRREFERPAGFLRSALRGRTWPPEDVEPDAEQRTSWAAWLHGDQDDICLPRATRREETMARYGIDDETMALWEQVRTELSWQMTRATFDTWIRPTLLLSVEGNVATLGVQSEAARAWLEHRLGKMVQRTFARHLGEDVALAFTLLETRRVDE